MNFAQDCKAKGIKLELGDFQGRAWRKTLDKKMHYFYYPVTKEGYALALEEWYLTKAKIAGERPNAKAYRHHIEQLGRCLAYYEAFGTPLTERKLHSEIKSVIDLIGELLELPVLYSPMPMGTIMMKYKTFTAEFISCNGTGFGYVFWQLPDKWQDRVQRMTPIAADKKPQTIGYWIDAYIARIKMRAESKIIGKTTAANRRHKLAHYKAYSDRQVHVDTITNEYLAAYHDTLQRNLELQKVTKKGYWDTFKMFVRWAASENSCDLAKPSKLDSQEEWNFTEPQGTGRKRMQKKKLLWTPEEFQLALTLPQPYKCFVLLFLNCGFRHVDLGFLRHDNLEVKGRIVYQRHKLEQQEKAPVVSYLLWDETIKAIEECKSDDKEFVFRNQLGNDVIGSTKLWWKRNKKKYGLNGKRLDYLRKTGSTSVARQERGLDTMYIGDVLDTTAQIHYSFTDGEPCEALDIAIQQLGFEFGFAQQPVKSVKLTPEVIEGLKKLGVAV